MSQVGMYKQQKYDEGIQKVQSYIDNVAGLDIYKDTDKAYLQGKLNELGSKLRTVAAGDFSNFQLVNSVGGMATQIVKDPKIQEAMTSTRFVRKGEEELETARKAGKSSIQNEAWWKNEVGSWLNDGQIASAFRGKYVEYRDMEKKLRDVAKEVHEYDKSIEIPFKRDTVTGNTLYFYKDAKGNRVATLDPSKGTPELDDAILKTRVKGKSAQKILDNFYISLDEDDKRQLGIDGWYHYRGYSGDQFKSKIKNDIVGTFNDKKKAVSEEIVRLTVELANDSNLTTAQREEKTTMLKNLQDLSKGGGLDKQLANRLSQVDVTDDLSLKQSVYTEKFLTRLADDIAYQDMETEFKTNPYQKALMDRKQLEFKYWNAQRQQENEDRNYLIAVERARREAAKDAREEAKEYKLLAGEQYIWKDLGVDTKDKKLPTLATLDRDILQIDKDINDFRVENRGFLIPNHQNLTDDEEKAALTKLLDEYLINPKATTDPEKIRLLEQYRAMELDKTRRISNRNFISQESEKKFGKSFEKALANETGIIDKNTGKELYSAAELSSVGLNLQQFVKYTTPSVGSSPLASQTKIIIDKDGILTKYKGTKYEYIAKAYAKKMSGEKLSSAEETILDKMRQINTKMGSAIKDIQKQRLDFESQKIGEMMPQFQQVATTLNMEDKETQKAVEIAIGNMYAFYDKLGSLETEKFNPNTVTSWRTEKGAKDLKYIIRKSADGSSGALIVMKGDEVQEIPLGAELGTYFPKAVTTNAMENIKVMIQGSPNKTTNVLNDRSGSSSAAVNAAFSGEMLPLLGATSLAPLIRFDVEGSKVNNGGPNDKFVLRMYVNDNGVWKSDIVNKQGYATYGGVMDMINNIGTAEYERIKNLR
jgi:hypothetical protein